MTARKNLLGRLCVNMYFNYIWQIEPGEANVTIKTMKILAYALDVKLSVLFDFTF